MQDQLMKRLVVNGLGESSALRWSRLWLNERGVSIRMIRGMKDE
jgi:hypothetical protein